METATVKKLVLVHMDISGGYLTHENCDERRESWHKIRTLERP